eukprot:c6003_g1_i1.p1 GENE.c6003_g1_i1~~c6003_g1_i1.p1  ORF type:complete len:151 (+),score=45.97 c6003_g1_i1:126-578(+)
MSRGTPGAAPMLTKDQQAQFKYAFELMDSTRKGKIGSKDLARVFAMIGLDDSEENIQEVLAMSGGEITFNKFLDVMSQSLENRTSDDILRATFGTFDTDASGSINLAEIRAMLTKMGENISDSEFNEMMRDVDLDHNGAIDYDEFKRMFD